MDRTSQNGKRRKWSGADELRIVLGAIQPGVDASEFLPPRGAQSRALLQVEEATLELGEPRFRGAQLQAERSGPATRGGSRAAQECDCGNHCLSISRRSRSSSSAIRRASASAAPARSTEALAASAFWDSRSAAVLASSALCRLRAATASAASRGFVSAASRAGEPPSRPWPAASHIQVMLPRSVRTGSASQSPRRHHPFRTQPSACAND
jgi:hypothetical protein